MNIVVTILFIERFRLITKMLNPKNSSVRIVRIESYFEIPPIRTISIYNILQAIRCPNLMQWMCLVLVMDNWYAAPIQE